MNVKQQYEGTLENMMIALENSPFKEIERDMSTDIDTQVAEQRSDLLNMADSVLKLDAEQVLSDIEYFNKVEAYKCGFRRAIHIMLDTFFGGESDE